ncbi:PID-CTERM protein-sorting domain-containing protein [Hymenobacter caeli]|uniref:VPDSG-CTERM sorting domain-containing protein n=1 Tax=Hymenobacter caeli TaxID=2735894 RepID=A0ABX2FR27_9BACT|nr:hypothetical protein [Hymenobacter caeli]NRT19387.1 hypothetical protein [Hymenobacter caeli]
MKKHTLRLVYATAVCVLCATASALAQPGSGGPTPTSPPTAVPIDGGASLLLASGVALGLKKLRDRRRAQRAR